ncbi:unnamed protein product [Blepharisma stoltei]|uniref:Dehydrogenase/reductase SDR family member 4 n=1 Tax=Blepharisma stoltei TaxID=1481888 RepID=A0AAU9JWY3_9CILI|nr:unnamed protein product [Blepharisma stoltei]
MKRYENKVCVITASATGIGLAIAKRMGQEGGKIVISSRNQKHIDAAVDELRKEGITAEGVVCHVGKDRQKLIDFAVEKFGGIDVLVNNAAIATAFGPTMEMSEQAYDRMFDVNVKAGFFLIKAALPWLVRSKSASILFVSSYGGFAPSPVIGIYCVTKTALIGMTKMLGIELAGAGIRVNAIAPGVIKTKFSEPIWETDAVTRNPMGRMGTPEECSSVAAFLCSEEASYVNGETVVIAGGFHARL